MSRRTDQRRAAVFALYQHEVTGRELGDVLERDASMFTRSLAYAAEDRSEELDELIARHAHGWRIERIAPLEKAIMRVALLEMLHPDAVPGDHPIPPEGAIDEAVETAKTFCGADAPGVRQRHPRRRAARDGREWRAVMTDLDTSTLDDLVQRLERAAEQLRSGDLGADAAAGLVEDCAALAGAGLGRARAHVARHAPPSRSRGRTAAVSGVRARATPPRYPRPTCASASRRYLEGLRFSHAPARPTGSRRRCATRCSPAASASGRCSRSRPRARSAATPTRCCRSPPRSS